MPKLLKHFTPERNFPPLTDYYVALYKAYKRYYLVFLNRAYVCSSIRFKNLLTAVMLFKEVEKEFILKKYTILHTRPYWVMSRQLGRKFWQSIKKKTESMILGGIIEDEVISIERIEEFLENE